MRKMKSLFSKMNIMRVYKKTIASFKRFIEYSNTSKKIVNLVKQGLKKQVSLKTKNLIYDFLFEWKCRN